MMMNKKLMINARIIDLEDNTPLKFEGSDIKALERFVKNVRKKYL